MTITTIDKLLETALPLQYNEILEDPFSHFEPFNFNDWHNIFGKVFNQKNGILAFTDNNNELYVIPNFRNSVKVLKNNGYREDLLMPVPLADGSLPTTNQQYWVSLQLEFLQAEYLM